MLNLINLPLLFDHHFTTKIEKIYAKYVGEPDEKVANGNRNSVHAPNVIASKRSRW